MGFSYQPVSMQDMAKAFTGLGTAYGALKPNLDQAKFSHTLEQDQIQNTLAWLQQQATQQRLGLEQAGYDRQTQKNATDLFMEMAKYGSQQETGRRSEYLQYMDRLRQVEDNIAQYTAKMNTPLTPEEQEYVAGLDVLRNALDTGLPGNINPSDQLGRQQIETFIETNPTLKSYVSRDARLRNYATEYLAQRAKDAEAAKIWHESFKAAINPKADLQRSLDEFQRQKQDLYQTMTPQNPGGSVMDRILPILAMMQLQPQGVFGGGAQQAPAPDPTALLGQADGQAVRINPQSYGGTMTTSDGKTYVAPTHGAAAQDVALIDAFNNAKSSKFQYDPLQQLAEHAQKVQEMAAQQQNGNPWAQMLIEAMQGGGQQGNQPPRFWGDGRGRDYGDKMVSGDLSYDVVVGKLLSESPSAGNLKNSIIQIARTQGPQAAQAKLSELAQGLAHYGGGLDPSLTMQSMMRVLQMTEADLPQLQM